MAHYVNLITFPSINWTVIRVYLSSFLLTFLPFYNPLLTFKKKTNLRYLSLILFSSESGYLVNWK